MKPIKGTPSKVKEELAVIEKMAAEKAKSTKDKSTKDTKRIYELDLSNLKDLSDKEKYGPDECFAFAQLLSYIRDKKLEIKSINLTQTKLDKTAMQALHTFLYGGKVRGKINEKNEITYNIIPSYRDKVGDVFVDFDVIDPDTKVVRTQSVRFKTVQTPTTKVSDFFEPVKANQNTKTTPNIQEIDINQESVFEDLMNGNSEKLYNSTYREYRAESIVGLKDEFDGLINDLAGLDVKEATNKSSSTTNVNQNNAPSNQNNNSSNPDSTKDDNFTPGPSTTPTPKK